MTPPAKRVLTIPAGVPFLPTLARAILDGQLPLAGGQPPTPLDLPRITLLLPTRRACKAMLDAFLAASGNRAMLLPHIRPIGGVDEDESFLRGLGADSDATPEALDVPAAIEPIERHLALTSLVMAWNRARLSETSDTGDVRLVRPAVAQTPAEASGLARGLARLMDQVETEGADLSRLAGLAPAEFAEQWRLTLDFLHILADAWPNVLASRGLISPAARRNRLLALEAERLTKSPPGDPYIIAGVSGSIPATARLMQVVAGLPQGAVVLSGLDQGLPDDAWAAVHPKAPSHPQFRLAGLLAGLGMSRAEVTELTASPVPDRFRFAGEALRPAETTAAWHDIATRLPPANAKAALTGIERLDAGSPEEEAEAVALILRRAAEDDGTSAALISPDRTLARRVATRLEGWGIAVDDSAGRPLSKTAPGVLLDLTLASLSRDCPPATLLALLKHPLTRLGLPVAQIRRGARMLELRALRRPNLGRGFGGLRAMLGLTDDPDSDDATEDALLGHHPAITGMATRDRDLARDVLARLEAALAPFVALGAGGAAQSVHDLVSAHIAAAEALAIDETGSPAQLWAETAGETASLFCGKLLEAGSGPLRLTLPDYPDLFRSLIATETARRARTSHPRLSILGPFEARLLDHDIVILGGLNDGVWPEIAEPDPWLNRPMLASLGLPQPEARIGDSAHDFVQLLGSRKVYLTRAAKLDGAPTVPSRWLLRFEALLAGLGLPDAFAGTEREPWLGWAQNQKALPEHRPRPASAPRPPLSARPRKLSVTRIEQWMANPYAIYARDILKLAPMPALGGPPEASVRGQIIHGALHAFSSAHPSDLPPDIAMRLIAEADRGLARLAAHPRVAAFWRPRFARFAAWFAATEPSRRIGLSSAISEVAGMLPLVAPGGPFVLTARADRIDLMAAGRLVITDYKSGTPPRNARVVDGTAPQLPLEAAIASAGGFAGIAAAPVAGLRFIAAGGGDPPGLEQPVAHDDPNALAAETLAGLLRLIALFDDPATPYAPLRRPSFLDAYRYDDYAHLARIAEWSLLAEGAGDE